MRKSLTIKKVLAVCSFAALFTSCVKNDNYEGPNASLKGNVYQDGTTDLVQACTGSFSIRLNQLSWKSNADNQDIPVKYDGTYQNTKLFSGHYSITIYGGAFWPIETEEMDIAQGSQHDFKLTPYLLLNNFKVDFVDSTTIALKFHLDAPKAGIPKIFEIQPYVNTTQIVGPGASIYDFSDVNKQAIGKEWSAFADADKDITLTVPGLIPGRTFYVRAGVKFDDATKSSNLSPVIKIEVPQAATK